MAKGKKNCPKCNIELGARILKCTECGHVFLSPPKKEKKKKNKKIDNEDHVERKGLDFSPTDYDTIKYSNKEINAKRILSYGKERAKSLLFLARKNNYWKTIFYLETVNFLKI